MFYWYNFFSMCADMHFADWLPCPVLWWMINILFPYRENIDKCVFHFNAFSCHRELSVWFSFSETPQADEECVDVCKIGQLCCHSSFLQSNASNKRGKPNNAELTGRPVINCTLCVWACIVLGSGILCPVVKHPRCVCTLWVWCICVHIKVVVILLHL